MALMDTLRLILLLSVLTGALPSTVPSIADFGFCAESGLMADFNFTVYGGDWYTIMSVPNSFATIRQCDVMSVQPSGNGSFSILSKGLDDAFQPVQQMATLERGGGEGGEVYLMLNSIDAPEVFYDIVSTDYQTYSCVYSCLSIASLRVELFWILSRDVSLSQAAKGHCLQVFEEMEVDTTKLTEVRQGEGDCKEVGNQEQGVPVTKTVSPTEETSWIDEEGAAPISLDNKIQTPSPPPPAGKKPIISSDSDEYPSSRTSNSKIKSYSKKYAPNFLSEEEMEDDEYIVLEEDYVDFNAAQRTTAHFVTAAAFGLFVVFTSLL